MAADVRENAGRSAAARRRPGRALLAALALALATAAGGARAQFAGTLALVNQNRYRGTATEDRGPVLRAGAMGDTSFGLYGGLSGIWRTRDGGLASAEAIVGASGRWNRLAPFSGADPAWGWDLAWHRTHYGESSRYDFSEAMAGLLAPGCSARLWWSPHYFGSDWSSLYGEVNASRALDERWRAFAHLGTLRYGGGPVGWSPPGRTDGSAGLAWALDDWELRLARDGLVDGHPFGGVTASRRRAGWLASAAVAF